MPSDFTIEGYAIVSEDGMLANAEGVMPPSLQFEADHDFFERGLDGIDAVVNGKHSNERQANSPLRRRLVVTRRAAALAPDPANERVRLWNPARATFEQALAQLGLSGGRIAIIGGTDVFGLFLDRYDVFFLSRAPGVRLPGGRPVFPGVPAQSPEAIMASHGMDPGPQKMLDAARSIGVVAWRRPKLAKPPNSL
jgi:dihydrofolate reductase